MGKFLFVFTLALFTSLEASGNPMWTESLRASAVDGPHVRLDYLAVKGGSGQLPVLGCHGTYCSPWQAGPDSSGNTGSGVKELLSAHMCDCYVPTGTELKYEPVDKPSYFTTATVKVGSYQGDPVPGGICQTECALGAGKADAALPEGTTDPKTESAGGGSCTFAPSGRQATLPLLTFVAAIIVLWRRRS